MKQTDMETVKPAKAALQRVFTGVQLKQAMKAPVQQDDDDFLDATHPPSALSAFCGTAIGLGGLTAAEHYVRTHGWEWGLDAFGFNSHPPVFFIGAFGALSALLYGAPAAPFGHPRATIFGFTLVMTLTLLLRYASLVSEYFLGFGLSVEIEQVLAPALGIGAFVLFDMKIHPPAAACAIQYMQLRHDNPQIGPAYLLAPVLIGVLWMLTVQLFISKVVKCVRAIQRKRNVTIGPTKPQLLL